MNSIWLMTSAEYAGDTSLFVRIQNVLLRENGGIFILTSLGLIFLLGLLMAAVCQRIHLPRIIGMLLTGIILGPYVLDLLDVSILNISSELRQIALIIILLKAGLSLDLKDLKKVGRSAVMLACVPATCELLAFVIFAPMILNISRVDAAVMGAVLAAVSPVVVVPRMVHLMESGYGTEKSIPQMILAGASCDDIYVIVLFSTFVGMAQGGQVNALDFVNIPVSILTGVLFGALVGWLLGQLFELLYRKGSYVRNSMKVIIIMGLSFLLMALETLLKGTVAFSGLLAVVSMACALKMRAPKEVTGRLSEKFGKLWLAAEVVLFVLVGAAVDIRYTMEAGLAAIGMILLALIFRSIGVTLCLLGTNLNKKERLFCMIAYLPKATVQAAIGSVPLAMGLPCGKIVLSVAVLAILITAPLGALGMDATYRKLLQKNGENNII